MQVDYEDVFGSQRVVSTTSAVAASSSLPASEGASSPFSSMFDAWSAIGGQWGSSSVSGYEPTVSDIGRRLRVAAQWAPLQAASASSEPVQAGVPNLWVATYTAETPKAIGSSKSI